MTNGWDASARGWIAAMGTAGDYARAMVLDRPMLERVALRRVGTALDVGCGEGRFCRLLSAQGIQTIGIDPTEALLAEAKARDPQGDYRPGRAEALDFADSSFDLVVSYLTLIDIPDIDRAIAEMARVLRPGGALLIANLTSFTTASIDQGWKKDENGEYSTFRIDHYLEERSTWVSWGGIRILNWHRPLSRYMSRFLAEGLILRYFDEPAPHGDDSARTARNRRIPWFVVMEWEKPAG